MAPVLSGVRQSKYKEASESPASQRKINTQWCEVHDHHVIHHAEDVGVSAEISPFDRKNLGPWITDPEKLAQWEILVVWKMDRLVRDMLHFYGEIVPYLVQKLGKRVVVVSENIDTATSSELEIAIRVSMATEELKKIKDRARTSRKALRETARFPGGTPRFGTYPVRREQGGYTLAIDQDALEELHNVVFMLKDGWSKHAVVCDLNERGVLTATDRHRVRTGKKPRGTRWSMNALNTILTSRHLLGHGEYKGEVIRHEDGTPVQFSDPLMDRQEWDELQTLVARPKQTQRRRGSSMLRQVVFCNECGRAWYKHPGGKKDVDRYMCASRSVRGVKDCGASGYPAAELEGIVEDVFLDTYGDKPVVTLEATKVLDHGPRLREIDEAMQQLEDDRYIRGRFSGDEGSRRFDRIYAKLEAERDELIAAQAANPPGVIRTETGETYRDLWEQSNREERGELLRQYGVVVMAQWKSTRLDVPLILAPMVSVTFPLMDEDDS